MFYLGKCSIRTSDEISLTRPFRMSYVDTFWDRGVVRKDDKNISESLNVLFSRMCNIRCLILDTPYITGKFFGVFLDQLCSDQHLYIICHNMPYLEDLILNRLLKSSDQADQVCWN